MQVRPRYDAPALMTIDASRPADLDAVIRQRRRLEASLVALDPPQWAAPTRCEGWSVKDVVAHLADVNDFWDLSIRAGLRGEPTRWLDGFDPVATPAKMVDATRAQGFDEVLAHFCDANARLCALLEGVTDAQCELVAEAPPGHLAIRLVASHALWDAWVHERDVALALGLRAAELDDEIAVSLRYVAALTAAFLVLHAPVPSCSYAVSATSPDVALVVELAASVTAGALVEALSFRVALPEAAGPQWRALAGGLGEVFESTHEDAG
jgi:uncharacterized protein (TIGR03083 family)